jgi:hypothetical protein
MAVNGVEIKVGQVWKSGAGRHVKIESVTGVEPYSVIGDTGHAYAPNGMFEIGRRSTLDLIKLVSDVPVGDNAELAAMVSATLDMPTGLRTVVDMSVPGYEMLADVLQRAYDQAAKGKGKERHANNKAFHEQPMQDLIRLHGVGFATGQASKKSGEALGLPAVERQVAELLGAIVYLSGAVIALEKNGGAQ